MAAYLQALTENNALHLHPPRLTAALSLANFATNCKTNPKYRKLMFDTLESAGKMGAALCAAAITFSASALNPVALPEATVTSGNARFTVLTPEMIRIEFSDMGVFEDRPTFTVHIRSDLLFNIPKNPVANHHN